jgi:hypothetical protein
MESLLTKAEETHVEKMADSFKEPAMSERFGEWAGRTISAAKAEEKKAEGRHRPREVKLEDRSDDEKKFIEAVGEKDETKDSTKESPRDGSKGRNEQRPNAKESEKPATSDPNNSPSEPLSGDRHWEALEGKVHFNEKEMQDHWKHVDNRAGVTLDYINNHPQKAQIQQGYQALMAGRRQAVDEPFFRDLSFALAEVPNPGEVFRHITLHPGDREIVRKVKNWRDLRAAIHTVSKHYAASAPQASPKARAPKPPGQVGFSGNAGDDGTRSANDFTDFSERQQRRHAR